jgi:hypothetical protein
MKAPNITPGKWRLDARLSSPLTLSGAGKHLATFHRDGNTTAQIHPSAGETEANARLIAAAPQLAEALELALSVIEDLPYPQNWPAEKLRSALLDAGYTE